MLIATASLYRINAHARAAREISLSLQIFAPTNFTTDFDFARAPKSTCVNWQLRCGHRHMTGAPRASTKSKTSKQKRRHDGRRFHFPLLDDSSQTIFFLRRRSAAAPAKPAPKSDSVTGSGTCSVVKV